MERMFRKRKITAYVTVASVSRASMNTSICRVFGGRAAYRFLGGQTCIEIATVQQSSYNCLRFAIFGLTEGTSQYFTREITLDV